MHFGRFSPNSLAIVVGAALALVGTPSASGFAQQTALRDRYAVELTELAGWCDEQGLKHEAAQTRAWLAPDDPSRLFVAAPRATSFPARADESSTETAAATEDRSKSAAWAERFDKLRKQQAAVLFDLANKAARNRQPREAMGLVWQVLREDPDHADARRVMGNQREGDRWLTPFEMRKLRDGQVWHDRFGWLPREQVARYEAGERHFAGGWRSAADDAKAHADIRNPWVVGTEHYVVRTNHSLEEGVRLAGRLERLHTIWEQVFLGFAFSDEQLARRFEGHAGQTEAPRRHKVVYFRSRDQYVRALAKDQPNIAITSGYYWGDKKEAYFFADGDADDGNLYHEATHQLFSESRPVVRDIGRDANFWIIEGVACYMESLHAVDGWSWLGGADAVRLRDARHRLFEDKFYVPFSELVGYGMERVQRDERIAMLYSQASGLTHFLMHYDHGRYRDALSAYLVAVYTGRDRPGTLAELTGTSYEDLDRQYREFLRALPE
jgi:hypothetical protein